MLVVFVEWYLMNLVFPFLQLLKSLGVSNNLSYDIAYFIALGIFLAGLSLSYDLIQFIFRKLLKKS